jgi:uncharacterized protein HemX
MNEPLVDELMRRVDSLERENRRWRLIGIGALLFLVLVVFGGGVLLVGTASMYTLQIREQRSRELEAAERAQMEALRAEQAAKQAAEETVKKFEEVAKQLQKQNEDQK